MLKLILANTKDKDEKIDELIQCCARDSQDTLIAKAAGIIDSFMYTSRNNTEQFKYCMKNVNALFKYKGSNFDDKIFNELKT